MEGIPSGKNKEHLISRWFQIYLCKYDTTYRTMPYHTLPCFIREAEAASQAAGAAGGRNLYPISMNRSPEKKVGFAGLSHSLKIRGPNGPNPAVAIFTMDIVYVKLLHLRGHAYRPTKISHRIPLRPMTFHQTSIFAW